MSGFPKPGSGTGLPVTGTGPNSLSVTKGATGVAPSLITTSSSDATVGLVIVLSGAGTPPAIPAPEYVTIAASPATAGGLLIADNTHNTGFSVGTGPGYGAGVFNGAIEVFAPSSSAQTGMPWVILGPAAGTEGMTLSYLTAPAVAGDYFLDAAIGDGILRSFTATSAVRIGPSTGNNSVVQASPLAVSSVTGAVVNGVNIIGTTTGNGPLIQARGDSSLSLNLFGKGTFGVQLGNGGASGASGQNIAALVGYATATSAVNAVAIEGAATGNPVVVGVSQLVGDTNIDLKLTTKGSGLVNIGYASTALGVGAPATNGLIGGSGPATATQNAWLKIKVNGTACFVPIWV